MREDTSLPNLKFPQYEYGTNETPFDLSRMLYHGGSAVVAHKFCAIKKSGALGLPLRERLDVVEKTHEFIAGKLASGGSPSTTRSQIKTLVQFYKWADREGLGVSMDTLQSDYIHWTDALSQRVYVAKSLSMTSAYAMGSTVGSIIDHVLDRIVPVFGLSRLHRRVSRRSPQGREAEKLSLASTFAFGHMLQDLCDGLSIAVIRGPRPVRVPLRSGRAVIMTVGMNLLTVVRPAGSIGLRTTPEAILAARAEKRRIAFESDKSLKTRSTLINMRITAEMLIFIGQTGMNLAQAKTLELRHFSYSSQLDGYKVRDYKARRGGEVLFEIYREYRSHFERYLEWRQELFPDTTCLFPFLRTNGAHHTSRPCFDQIKKACNDVGVKWLTPRLLRSTRVNWLLRRSGDGDLTAEMAQHRKETLVHFYEIPSQQRAINEVTRFWMSADPSLCDSMAHQSVAPGSCDGIPSTSKLKPGSATSPDCIHPSGCLWCEHHRDIDSLDYVWALASFRYLKSLELSWARPAEGTIHTEHPSHQAIERISEKLDWFRKSDSSRRAWAEEAQARMEEGSYHPEWCRLIESIEGTST